jgi:hypothetical protein
MSDDGEMRTNDRIYSHKLTPADWIRYQWMAVKLRSKSVKDLQLRLGIINMCIKEWRQRGNAPSEHMLVQQKIIQRALRKKVRAWKDATGYEDEHVVVGLKPINLDKEMLGMTGKEKPN